MEFYLAGKSGAARGRLWPLKEQVIIGRDFSCGLSLNDGLVSRRHCAITIEHGEVYLEDLGSSNSTLINGAPTKRTLLTPGDEIAVGGSLLLFCCIPVQRTECEENGDPATARVRIGDRTTMLREEEIPEGTPRTIEDLAELFSVGRDLSRASSVDGLVTMLLQRLSERFRPKCLWVAKLETPGERALVFPASATEEFNRDKELHQRVIEAHRSHKPQGWNDASGDHGILAPVTVAGETKVVLIMRFDAKLGRLPDPELELLLAIAHGAAPYFTVVERIEQLERENVKLIAGMHGIGPIIGSHPAVQQMRNVARNCARSNLSVLITGETGTGKELVARMIHELSHLSTRPMVTVNCAALPEELFESELFGHERGAFTGAHARKNGLLEQCDGGTLFLDEVGDLSLQNQARLLRAIETGTFRRVGGSADIKVEFRLISATNMPLHQHVERNQFRRDFYHRLAGLELSLPALRERRSDIPELAYHFLKHCRERHRHRAEGFSAEALQALERYNWPGNIRELRNVVERAAVLAQQPWIMPQDLSCTTAPAPAQPAFLPLAELERTHITEALKLCRGNVQEAAAMLGIGRSTLYRKLEEFHLTQKI